MKVPWTEHKKGISTELLKALSMEFEKARRMKVPWKVPAKVRAKADETVMLS